ncbi:DUF4422 domain-containing protein [Pelagibacteraceae bacterium]|nr:DUF4422 domain-containing protein [Pelagibacteraceae bacterium]
MKNLNIYCFSLKYYKMLDGLPDFIKPLGLGENSFPKNWLDEKKGENISKLNNFFAEATGIYWIWKNEISKMKSEDWVGTCHHRRFWLDNEYEKKQKTTLRSLHSKLLNPDNKILIDSDAIQVQPIILKNETVLEQFNKVHDKNNDEILNSCVNFLDKENRENFKSYLNKNQFSITIFLSKVKFFDEYCSVLFPWLDKCYNFCKEKKLLKGYNNRLPAFMMERFASYWIKTHVKNLQYLSYARVGNLMLSNKINNFFNPMKIPATFRMYPTRHDY